jgi:hypothetical protein
MDRNNNSPNPNPSPRSNEDMDMNAERSARIYSRSNLTQSPRSRSGSPLPGDKHRVDQARDGLGLGGGLGDPVEGSRRGSLQSRRGSIENRQLSITAETPALPSSSHEGDDDGILDYAPKSAFHLILGERFAVEDIWKRLIEEEFSIVRQVDDAEEAAIDRIRDEEMKTLQKVQKIWSDRQEWTMQMRVAIEEGQQKLDEERASLSRRRSNVSGKYKSQTADFYNTMKTFQEHVDVIRSERRRLDTTGSKLLIENQLLAEAIHKAELRLEDQHETLHQQQEQLAEYKYNHQPHFMHEIDKSDLNYIESDYGPDYDIHHGDHLFSTQGPGLSHNDPKAHSMKFHTIDQGMAARASAYEHEHSKNRISLRTDPHTKNAAGKKQGAKGNQASDNLSMNSASMSAPSTRKGSGQSKVGDKSIKIGLSSKNTRTGAAAVHKEEKGKVITASIQDVVKSSVAQPAISTISTNSHKASPDHPSMDMIPEAGPLGTSLSHMGAETGLKHLISEDYEVEQRRKCVSLLL